MYWRELASGDYNKAYRSADGKKVLKIQKLPILTRLDVPERSVRLWNEINPHLSPKAYVTESVEYGSGWVCPYVEGTKASPDEICSALLDIYSRTGRVVIDAIVTDNFVRMHDGQIVCVDIGLALQLEQRQDHYMGIKRYRSIVSLNFWDERKSAYRSYFASNQSNYPKIIATLKALLFIKHYRSDIDNVRLLGSQDKLITQLASAFDGKDIENALNRLDSETSRTILYNIKKRCKDELAKYIHSRGSINPVGDFIPSNRTRFFRTSTKIRMKIDLTTELINKIEQSKSLVEIEGYLQSALETNGPRRSGGKAKYLQNCTEFVYTAKQAELQVHTNSSSSYC